MNFQKIRFQKNKLLIYNKIYIDIGYKSPEIYSFYTQLYPKYTFLYPDYTFLYLS